MEEEAMFLQPTAWSTMATERVGRVSEQEMSRPQKTPKKPQKTLQDRMFDH